MQGLLLFDKPAGWTSFDAVNFVRKLAAKKIGIPPRRLKVGHSGTLDPFATGLLIILVGKKYTARSQELLKLAKSYQATMILGSNSTTGDPEGEISSPTDIIPRPSIEQVNRVLNSFIGESMQTPPAYSAIKINGVRAYKLARDNRPVLPDARVINIYRIELLEYDFPLIKFNVEVSSGTYVRSLVETIGNRLGSVAYTQELRRTGIGNYSIFNSTLPEDINEQTIERLLIELP